MWPFFNPAIEVVTFRLHGWCMLGVFLWPAFTCPGHECHDLLSLRDGMHMCTDISLYSHPRLLGNGVRSHVNSKGEIPSTGGSEEGWIHNTASRRTVSPTHCPLSYSGPSFNPSKCYRSYMCVLLATEFFLVLWISCSGFLYVSRAGHSVCTPVQLHATKLTHSYVKADARLCTGASLHVTYRQTHRHTDTHTHKHRHTHACVFKHWYIHTHTHTHTHNVHTHTHTHWTIHTM